MLQLQEQLVQKEKELQMREVEEELRVEQKQAQDWERPAGEEREAANTVYSSQYGTVKFECFSCSVFSTTLQQL